LALFFFTLFSAVPFSRKFEYRYTLFSLFFHQDLIVYFFFLTEPMISVLNLLHEN